MTRSITVGFGMLVGAALGAAAVGALNAQSRAPAAYAVFDISEITNQRAYDALIPKFTPANEAFSGKQINRPTGITTRDGIAPARFAIVAFDSIEQAKAWSESPAQKEIDAIRIKSTKSRSFIVDGITN